MIERKSDIYYPLLPIGFFFEQILYVMLILGIKPLEILDSTKIVILMK